MNEHPISLTVDDDLKRWRLTVFFRFFLTIPHFFWLFLWGIAVFLAAIINWFATLILGRSPDAFHSFIGSFVRYVTHVTAYLFLIADKYPGFVGRPGFPIDLEIDPPAAQNRWKTFFRVFLAIPATLLAGTLTFGTGESNNSGGVLSVVGFLGWFASLVKGEMPRGMRNLGAYSLGYGAQTWSYLFLLTDRYPNSDPVEMGSAETLPEHPITMTVEDDLRRSRLTVFFRLLLTIPHFVWLFLWGIAVIFATIANWFATLIAGQSPDSLHRFLAAYLRYETHVGAYLFLVANPFPGFVGEAYAVELRIAPPERQNRWITGFRLALIIPVWIISWTLFAVTSTVAFLAWFAALVLGRMPLGLRNLGAYALRYFAQQNAYLYVLTDTYPFSGPPALTEPADAGSEPPSVEPSPEPSF